MKTRGGSITWGQFGNIRESKIPKFSPPTAAFYPYKSRFLDLQISKFSPPTAAFYPYKSWFLYLQIPKISPPPAAFCLCKSRFLDIKISKKIAAHGGVLPLQITIFEPQVHNYQIDPQCMTSNLTPSAWPWFWPQVHDFCLTPSA